MKTLRTIMVPILIVTAVFAIYTFNQTAQAEIDVNESASDLPFINVTGVGEITVEPDSAQISLGVRTENTTAKQALEDNAVIANRLLAAIVAAGVEKKNIQTQNFSVQPQYDYNVDRGNTHKLVGYQVQNSVVVKIDDISKLGAIIDTARDAGVNEVSNIRFLTNKDKVLQTDALTKAVENAKYQADTIAAALGKKVHDVVSVSTISASAPTSYLRTMDMAESANFSTPIMTGELTVTASVHVQYSMK